MSGAWDNPSNWSSGSLPASTDDVTVSSTAVNGLTISDAETVNSIQGNGTISITGGSLTIFSASEFDGELSVSGGTLQASGALSLGGTMAWTGGTESGTLDVGSSATLAFSGGNNKVLSDLTLNNAGTIDWTGGNLGLQDSSTIDNESGALFDIETDNVIVTMDGGDSTVSAVDNAGTLEKNAGTGTTTFQAGGSGATAVLNNTGTVEINSGTLNLSDGGTNSTSGTFDVESTGTLQFSGDTFTLDNGSTFTGAGYTHVTGGTLNIAGNVTVDTFEMDGGTVSGTGTLTVNIAMLWTGGTVSGTLGVGSSATLTFSTGNNKVLSNLALDNAGTIDWTGGNLGLQDSSTIDNESGALFDIETDNTIVTMDGGDNTVSALDNAGTLRKDAGTGTTTFQSGGNGATAVLNNTGTVEVNSGTLNLSDGGSNSATGTFAVASAGLVQFSGGTFTLDGGSTFTGNGLQPGDQRHRGYRRQRDGSHV